MSQIYIIAGPNGAGKTTCAFNLMPKLIDCFEYVNADSIASALSPFQPETTAIQAGRLMLKRINALILEKADFAFETTLASRSFAPLIKKCQSLGYHVNLLFLWLKTPELAVARVAERVANGGHNIPKDVILRRYKRAVQNFVNLYVPIVNDWSLYDNSENQPAIIASCDSNKTKMVLDKTSWQNFIESK